MCVFIRMVHAMVYNTMPNLELILSEAAAVNLVAKEKPADVYSELAANLQVVRKLVKQTVMTLVYGVTYVGAREQIKQSLVDKGRISDDSLLFTASCYAAQGDNGCFWRFIQ